jgi:Domain of unknown function (DUF222)
MLAMGFVAAGRKVATAAALAARLPATLAAMSAGDLDSWRATIIATQLAEANAASCAEVEALIYPAVLGETPGAVTRRVRRVLARVDADALRLKAAKERLDRFVRAYPSQVPGLTTWVASLPAADSAACWAAIDALAHQGAGDDPTRTLGQARADALVDLMLTNVQVATTVTLMIPVQTATVNEPDGSREQDLIVRHTNNATAHTNPGRDAIQCGPTPAGAASRTLNPWPRSTTSANPPPSRTRWSNPPGPRSPRWATRSPASASSAPTSSPPSWTTSTPPSPASCSTNEPA